MGTYKCLQSADIYIYMYIHVPLSRVMVSLQKVLSLWNLPRLLIHVFKSDEKWLLSLLTQRTGCQRASDCLSSISTFPNKPLRAFIQTWWTHSLIYGTPQVWLIFGHAPLNLRCFSLSGWLSSFHAFADKPLITWSLNLVGQLIIGYPKLHKLLVTLHWIPAVFWPLIHQTFSMHLQRNCWVDWAQIWWSNSLWPPQAWLNFGHVPLNFHGFLVSGFH